MDNSSQKIDFTEVLNQKPTIEWRERLKEELADEELSKDEIKYNEGMLDETDHLITDFIKDLSDLNGNNNRDSILSVVKKFVFKLNDLNTDQNYFETGEREDICDFVDKAVTKAGLKLEEFEDVTEEWREW